MWVSTYILGITNAIIISKKVKRAVVRRMAAGGERASFQIPLPCICSAQQSVLVCSHRIVE